MGFLNQRLVHELQKWSHDPEALYQFRHELRGSDEPGWEQRFKSPAFAAQQVFGRMIRREAGIAIDGEDRLLRRADVARSKLHELMVESGDQINAGRFDLLLVDVLATLEPRAPVVTGKLAQKVEGSRRVTGEAHSFSHGF